MCACVCARVHTGPGLQLHPAVRTMGSHGRLDRVGGGAVRWDLCLYKVARASGWGTLREAGAEAGGPGRGDGSWLRGRHGVEAALG